MKLSGLARKLIKFAFENPLVFRSKNILFMSWFFLISIFILNQFFFIPEKPKEIKIIPEDIKKEILFWQKISEQFPDYRDAYLKLSILDWKASREFDSKKNLEKVLEIDPNDKTAISLQGLLLEE